MDKKLFRKKSVDKVTSPDQLTDYIRVSNPCVWMILAAILILLAGACTWGIFGKMDTVLTVATVSENGAAVCYVKESDITSVKKGMTVNCKDHSYTIAEIPKTPMAVDGSIDEYALHVGDLKAGEWVYRLTLEGTLIDGIYPGEIVIDRVSPISFVFN